MMNFLLSDELVQFEESLSKVFKNAESTWEELSGLGALMASVPENYSGLGFGLLGAEIIVEQEARVLSSLPLFETLAFGVFPLQILGSSESKEKYFQKISEGALKLTGGFHEIFQGEYPLRAKKEGGGYFLTGELSFVSRLESVEGIIVPARIGSAKQPSLFLVSGEGYGKSFASEKLECLDLKRSYARIVFDGVPAELLSKEKIPSKLWQNYQEHLLVLIAAELVGASRAILELTVEYVGTRTQFGVPVGSFQAVQHKLSDMLLELEQAHTLVRYAAWIAEQQSDQLSTLAPAVKAFSGEVAPRLIEEALQAHGGIGFTYDYKLHYYLRRVKTLSVLYGSSSEHYRRLGELLLS